MSALSDDAVVALEATTLLLNPHNGTIFSARHRVFMHFDPNEDDDLAPATAAVSALLRNGDYVVANADASTTIPTCTACGCTEDFACETGCAWANSERTLCTTCAE
jgi:hypothetical protein